MELVFQLLDCDYILLNNSPLLRLFGKTKEGKVVCAFYKNFYPYFYILPKKGKEDEIIRFLEKNYSNLVLAIRKVFKFLPIGFQKSKTKLLKIFLRDPSKVPKIREDLREKVENLFEADILFKYRFMADFSLSGLGWVKVKGKPTNTNSVRSERNVEAEEIKSIGLEGNAPLKYMAIDIEVVPKKEGLPDSKRDPVILIGISFYPAFNNSNTLVLVARRTKKRKDILPFENEKEMLEEFLRIVERFDPDVIVGYNINNFDLPYLLDRLRENKLSRNLGRCKDKPASSKKVGSRTRNYIPGRVVVDVYELVKESAGKGLLRLKRFGLGDVSKALLGEDKIDIKHSEISKYWRGSEEQLNELINYTRKDAILALRILLEKNMLDKFIEISKVSGLLLQDVLDSGESSRIENLLLREFNKHEYVIPCKPTAKEVAKRNEERIAKGFKGALVLEPETGLHTSPVIYLDFKAMYPSIFIAYNICPTTLLLNGEKLESVQTPYGSRFVSKKVKEGIIPKILARLIEERDKIKAEMKRARGEKLKTLDAKQYALKIMANAFYGYTGYARGRLYVLDIASGITSCGRYLIQRTKEIVESEGFKVVYGDSVDYNRRIILLDPDGIVRVMKIGEFVDSFFEDVEEENQSKFINGWKALCLENGRPMFQPVVRVVRHLYNPREKGDLLKIKTKWGETIVTPQHSIYGFVDGKPKLMDAKELTKSSMISVLTKIPNVETVKEIDILKLCKKRSKNIFLYIPPEFVPEDLKDEILKRHVRKRRHVFVIPIDRVGDLEEKLRERKILRKCFIGGYGAYPFRGKKNTTIPAIIELSEELGYLLGIYVAEGCAINKNYKYGRKVGISISNKNRKIIQKIKKSVEKIFGKKVKPFVCDKKSKTYRITLNGLAYYFFFKDILQAGDRSENKRIPPVILSSPLKVKLAFYKGYMEGDGNLSYPSTPRFSTLSEGLRDDLTVLLKMLNLRKIVSYYFRPSKKTWRITYSNYSRGCKFSLDKYVSGISIKSIEKVRPSSKFVYDIEVGGAHNFVDAHGCVLLHNTDSVMVKAGVKDIEKAFEVGKELEKRINEKLEGIVKMKIESVFKTLLILTKKRYAGLAVEKLDGSYEEKIVMKGIETVRRDWCDLVSKTLYQVLEILLKEQNPRKAFDYVKGVLEKLEKNEIPLEDLVITKSISKNPKDYKGIQPHVELVKKLRKRSPAEAPGVGDRVSFVIVKGPQLVSKRAEDPEYVKKHNLKIDSRYYIESQLLPPLERVFETIGYSKAELIGIGKQLLLSEAIKNKVRVKHEALTSFESFICKKCNTVYRRIPLIGKCVECGDEILFFSNGNKSRYLRI